MFGIGGFELFLILLFGFLVFGPDKLPEIAKTAGRAIAKFRTAQDEMKSTLNAQSFMDKDAEDPFKNPLEVIERAAGDAQAKTAKAQAEVSAATDKAAEKISEKSASFAERKAAYDKARAERKAAEAAAAHEQAAQAAAAKDNPKTEVPAKAAACATDDAEAGDA
ncbi:twin-arginine translocase TatA/TatE family subunit [Adlercreutzia murintestinalis]|uniref:twin-arginine translocase TatA/TatE family subunit n=1 Tax=Adlercreutzia murintestinalis TaxID=2941325 RepID=UPI0020424F95|nr:twin-arginine translocase TatA/TatE family subunit [Adlercreutzia murintestinalis]